MVTDDLMIGMATNKVQAFLKSRANIARWSIASYIALIFVYDVCVREAIVCHSKIHFFFIKVT